MQMLREFHISSVLLLYGYHPVVNRSGSQKRSFLAQFLRPLVHQHGESLLTALIPSANYNRAVIGGLHCNTLYQVIDCQL